MTPEEAKYWEKRFYENVQARQREWDKIVAEAKRELREQERLRYVK